MTELGGKNNFSSFCHELEEVRSRHHSQEVNIWLGNASVWQIIFQLSNVNSELPLQLFTSCRCVRKQLQCVILFPWIIARIWKGGLGECHPSPEREIPWGKISHDAPSRQHPRWEGVNVHFIVFQVFVAKSLHRAQSRWPQQSCHLSWHWTRPSRRGWEGRAQ